MTSTPLPAAPQTTEGIAPPAVPLEESVRAIEHTRQLLEEAISALDSGDDDQLAHAYERTAGCADHVARALWFLRRVAREHTAPGAPAVGTAGATGSI